MRSTLTAAVVLLLGISPTLVMAAPATTAPSVPRPAGAQANEDARPRVLVMPFDELSDAPKREWIGQAMQRALVAELTRSGLVAVMTPPTDAPAAKDVAAVASVGRDMHAPLAIVASYQVVDQNLRVTGQMIETVNGEHIAAIKADGSLRDLFAIEDMIGNQVRRDLQVILRPPTAMSSSPSKSPGSGDPFQVQPTGPVQQPAPTGAYDGSDLQRSLAGDDQWAPPAPLWQEDARNRSRYDYPPPYYYPGYGYSSYYDYCGYYPWRPTYGRPVVPAGPGPSTPIGPNNNYATSPGQMGRSSGGNQLTGPPGQMGRTNGGNQLSGPPGQSRGAGGSSSSGSRSSGSSSSSNTRAR
jgi:TolB-like protein